MERIVRFCLQQRIILVVVALALVAFGVRALQHLSVDAFPDVTNVQVQIATEAPGRSPEEVERFITIPLEIGMTGLPGLTEMRSINRNGLSLITLVFRDDVDVFFAPSGTDLEYVALLAVSGRREGGVVNLLLGADEVGSGCIHSAAGQYFAQETACGVQTEPRRAIAGLPPIEMADLPVRNPEGEAHDSTSLAEAMATAVGAALDRDRFPLVHIVHGSKTGLVLPHLDE